MKELELSYFNSIEIINLEALIVKVNDVIKGGKYQVFGINFDQELDCIIPSIIKPMFLLLIILNIISNKIKSQINQIHILKTS